MLKNFRIVPNEQVPQFPPFRGAVCVTDGPVRRLNGFDFKGDAELITDLILAGELVNEPDVFYLPLNGNPQQIHYDDCGKITGTQQIHVERGSFVKRHSSDQDAVRDYEYLESVQNIIWMDDDLGVFLSCTTPGLMTDDHLRALALEFTLRWNMIDDIHRELDGEAWDSATSLTIAEIRRMRSS